jgi:hypothetical protein
MKAKCTMMFHDLFFTALLVGLLIGCKKQAAIEPEGVTLPAGEYRLSGEELMINAIDEMVALADLPTTGVPAKGGTVVAKMAADSVYVYGQVTSDGFGAVVTERHTYPKGLLLIAVRKSFGRAGRIISDTRQYISVSDFRADLPQQSTLTEVAPLSRDTILTRVVRNGLTETYTFRLPVVTRTVNQTSGTTTVTSRFASGGAVVSEVMDGTGTLVRRTRSTALSTGGLQTRTEYPDGSWRSVTVLGRGDGSVLRDIQSGTL